MSRFRRPALIAFVLGCLAVGAWLRFKNIGRPEFWLDEFFHVYAAQSWLKDGSLTVPLHGEYTRAFPITWITAQSFRFFGVSETSARAPFAIANLLFLLVSFGFIRRLYGLRAAAGTLVVLTLAPLMIQMSRECRMYTVFQLLYFGCFMSMLLGLEPLKSRPGWEGRWGIDARWLAASLVLLPMSASVQGLTWTGFIVVALYCLTFFVADAWKRGLRTALPTRYGIPSALVIAGLAVAIAGFHGAIGEAIRHGNRMPDWMIRDNPAGYYRRMFTDAYPILFYLYPIAAFAFIRNHGRRGYFAVLSFVALFALHSLVIARKDERYVFYVFPFFALVSAAFVADLLAALAERMRPALTSWPRVGRAAAAAGLLALAYPFLYPWLTQGLRVSNINKDDDWRHQAQELRDVSSGHVLLTTNPVMYLYYLGRLPDFYMLGEVWPGVADDPRLVRTTDDLNRFFDRSDRAMVVSRVWQLHNPAFFSDEMTGILERRTDMTRSPLDTKRRLFEEKI